jgi:hypothetical protein
VGQMTRGGWLELRPAGWFLSGTPPWVGSLSSGRREAIPPPWVGSLSSGRREAITPPLAPTQPPSPRAPTQARALATEAQTRPARTTLGAARPPHPTLDLTPDGRFG